MNRYFLVQPSIYFSLVSKIDFHLDILQLKQFKTTSFKFCTISYEIFNISLWIFLNECLFKKINIFKICYVLVLES